MVIALKCTFVCFHVFPASWVQAGSFERCSTAGLGRLSRVVWRARRQLKMFNLQTPNEKHHQIPPKDSKIFQYIPGDHSSKVQNSPSSAESWAEGFKANRPGTATCALASAVVWPDPVFHQKVRKSTPSACCRNCRKWRTFSQCNKRVRAPPLVLELACWFCLWCSPKWPVVVVRGS